MPLDNRTVSKLVKDLDTYRTEKEWADRNTEKVAEKGSNEEVEWLKERQDKANNALKTLERNITKAIIKGFPEQLGRPEALKPEVVSVPAEEPAIIEIPKTVLERINETLVAQKTQIATYTAIAKEQLKAEERQSETLSELKEVTEADVKARTEVHEITYPSGEDTKSIPVGTIELDMWTGDVYLGDGTKDRLSDSLQRLKTDFIRSVYVDVSKAYTVEIDGKADHAMDANDPFVLSGISCRNVSVTVSEPATLKFWSSTNPDARLESAKSLVVAEADELQLFTDEEIRDTDEHNSLIFDYSDYAMVTFYVDNDLNQDVLARVYGNRTNSVTKAVYIGSSFNVGAGDATAKVVVASQTGIMPYMFVRLTASIAPTSGEVNVYAISQYTS